MVQRESKLAAGNDGLDVQSGRRVGKTFEWPTAWTRLASWATPLKPWIETLRPAIAFAQFGSRSLVSDKVSEQRQDGGAEAGGGCDSRLGDVSAPCVASRRLHARRADGGVGNAHDAAARVLLGAGLCPAAALADGPVLGVLARDAYACNRVRAKRLRQVRRADGLVSAEDKVDRNVAVEPCFD
eukprot:3930434-Pleurochrysis_carterae.AAC.3